MNRATFLIFTAAVLCFFALLWGAELILPKSGAGAIVLVASTALGIWIVRPGWNFRPLQCGKYGLMLFGLLFASAAVAAWFLTFFRIPVPYDFTTLKIATAVPGIIAITGIEELLFRQVMYRWLEQRQVLDRSAVAATALAFGCAHLGPIFIGNPIGATFFLLQSAYMLWVGTLLGEIRHVTSSWLMSWIGHFGYNIAVLYFLSAAY